MLRTDGTDGGPAFPNAVPKDFYAADVGMSLRDWFAGQALAGMLSCPEVGGPMDKIAEWSYSYADAMIKVRDE